MRRVRLSRSLAVAVSASVALVAVVAGCGGGGSSSSGEPLTAAEYRTQANAICAEIQPKVRGVPVPDNRGGIPGYVSAVLPLWQEQADQLRALQPPAELEQDANALVKALDDTTRALVDLQAAAERGDVAAFQDAFQRGNRATTKSTQLAQSLGLTDCAPKRS